MSNSKRLHRRAILSCWLAATIAGCGAENRRVTPPPPATASEVDRSTDDQSASKIDTSNPVLLSHDAMIDQVNELLESGQLTEAAERLSQLLVRNPKDVEALFYLANVRAEQGQRQQAIDLLEDISPEEPEAGLAALGVSAQWCFELEQYAEAEHRYLKILELAPDANLARRPLAYLYNRQGRRHEAVKLVRELCRSGDVTQDELHSLIVEADAMYDAPDVAISPDTRPYFPIGEMGQARFHFTNNEYAEAAALVEPLLRSGEADASTVAFYGFAIAESQSEEQFTWWLSQTNESVREYPEYWAAIGAMLMAETRFEDGLGALAEAVSRDPTDIRSTRRIVQAFRSLGKSELAQQWVKRYERLNKSVTVSIRVADGGNDAIAELATELESLGRNLEAILWRGIAAVRAGAGNETMDQLNTQRLSVLREDTAISTRDEILRGWEIKPFSDSELSRLTPPPTSNHSRSRLETAAPARMRNISEAIGLEHRYRIGTQPRDHALAIYQQNGGGAAVIDYDLDGSPDLYLAQGAADPPEFIATQSDQLFRTLGTSVGAKVSDATRAAGLVENHYTLGVTSGDWNQDGFPDLAVANIGPNVLLINQGDGTFHQVTLPKDDKLITLSTSLAMGDINGDRLPDLYVANYLRDPRIATTPALDGHGNAVSPMTPHHFLPVLDQVWFNDGRGGASAVEVGRRGQDESYGLGLVLTNFLDSPGNEIFVGNDARANQLWSYSAQTGQWQDSAVSRGCAFGSFGAPTASMGIATGDFDSSGSLDLHVTNFQNESACLYFSRDGLFRDLNVKYGIDRLSTSVLGFGTQAIDYSNDGRIDLIVANGHIENLESLGQPFRQPMQLLANLGDRFVAANVEDSTQFWSRDHLGRSLVRVDLNRDGKSDVVVTDLTGPTAVLLNETDTENHWIGVRLVGTECERDAIGSRVEFQSGGERRTEWLNAGDGYLGKNDSSLLIGLGQDSNIASLTVIWPSGRRQEYSRPPVDTYVLVTEGETALLVEHP